MSGVIGSKMFFPQTLLFVSPDNLVSRYLDRRTASLFLLSLRRRSGVFLSLFPGRRSGFLSPLPFSLFPSLSPGRRSGYFFFIVSDMTT